MNLVTAFKVAQIAAQNLKNEKRNKSIISIILAPMFLIMLLFSVLVYIIISPLQAILGELGGDDRYGIENIKNQVSTIEYTDPGSYPGSYPVDNNPVDYTKNSIKQGSIEVVYYNQGDNPWRNMLYGTIRTIGISGCGPTSMAIVISTFTGLEVTPAVTSEWSYKNGYLVQGYNNGQPYAMSSHALVPALAKEYNLNCTGIRKDNGTADKLYKALSDGKLVVAIMGPGHFTSGGHFIVLRGVTKEGKILVADCGSRQRTNQEWDINTIINESKGGAGAGGPFWAISKNKIK